MESEAMRLPPPVRENLATIQTEPFVREEEARDRPAGPRKTSDELWRARQEGIDARRDFGRADDDMLPLAIFLAAPEEKALVVDSLSGGRLAPLFGAAVYVTEGLMQNINQPMRYSPRKVIFAVAGVEPDPNWDRENVAEIKVAAPRRELFLAIRLNLGRTLGASASAAARNRILSNVRSFKVAAAFFAATNELMSTIPNGGTLVIRGHLASNGAFDGITLSAGRNVQSL